jgi:hypothetical protein
MTISGLTLEQAHVLLGERLVEDREQFLAVLAAPRRSASAPVELGNVGIGDAGLRVDAT